MKKSSVKVLKEMVDNFKKGNSTFPKKFLKSSTGKFSDKPGTLYTYVSEELDIIFDIVLIGKVENTPYYECRLSHHIPYLAQDSDYITKDIDGMMNVVITPITLYFTEEEIRRKFMLISEITEEDLDIVLNKDITKLPFGMRGLTISDEDHPIIQLKEHLTSNLAPYIIRIFHIMDLLEE